MNIVSAPAWECKHCHKKFLNERNFMKHQCTKMVRSVEIQSIIGQQAYGLYKIWLEKQRKKAPQVETFISSAYYTSFINFANWVRETGVPDPAKYVEQMIHHKISPALWRRNEAYQYYLEYVDQRSDPYEQAQITVETVQALAEGCECKPGEIFSKFKVGEILELAQQRRLSPWLLFCSSKFKEWVHGLDEHERNFFMQGIGITYWSGRLERAAPDTIKNLKEIAGALGI